jgi:hypothetical protein
VTNRPLRLRWYLGAGIGARACRTLRATEATRPAAELLPFIGGGSISRTSMGCHTDSEGRPSEQRLLAKTLSSQPMSGRGFWPPIKPVQTAEPLDPEA